MMKAYELAIVAANQRTLAAQMMVGVQGVREFMKASAIEIDPVMKHWLRITYSNARKICANAIAIVEACDSRENRKDHPEIVRLLEFDGDLARAIEELGG